MSTLAKKWRSEAEREYDRGFTDACEIMECGHPRACRLDFALRCTGCAREGKIAQRVMASEFIAAEKQRLLQIAMDAISDAVPTQTQDWLDGVKVGVERVKEALERA